MLHGRLSRAQAALAGGAAVALLTAAGLGINRARKRLAWRRKQRNAPVLLRDMVPAKHPDVDDPLLTPDVNAPETRAADAPRH